MENEDGIDTDYEAMKADIGKTPYKCSRCGRELRDEEMAIMFINPNSKWWLNLFDSPQYCFDCSKIIKSQSTK